MSAHGPAHCWQLESLRSVASTMGRTGGRDGPTEIPTVRFRRKRERPLLFGTRVFGIRLRPKPATRELLRDPPVPVQVFKRTTSSVQQLCSSGWLWRLSVFAIIPDYRMHCGCLAYLDCCSQLIAKSALRQALAHSGMRSWMRILVWIITGTRFGAEKRQLPVPSLRGGA